MTGPTRGHLSMLLFSALVAGSFSLGVLVANDLPPVALNVVRFALAALLIGAYAQLSSGIKAQHFAAPWRYLVLGAVFSTYFVLMFEGLKSAPPVSAAAVFTLTPPMAGVAGWFILRQVTTPRMALALSVGGAGALWVIFRADFAALIAVDVGRGELIYFLGCIAHAIYIPLVKALNRGEPAGVFAFGTTVAGLCVMAAWGWPAIMATDWTVLPALVWWTIGYIAVMATAVTFVLIQYASLQLPSAKVMAYTYLTPSWVIVWEIALGHGAPTMWVLIGVSFTIVALLLLLRDDSQVDGRAPNRRSSAS